MLKLIFIRTNNLYRTVCDLLEAVHLAVFLHSLFPELWIIESKASSWFYEAWV